MTSSCREAGSLGRSSCAWCGGALEPEAGCRSIELEANVHVECRELLAVVCAWCGWPLELGGNCFAAELGGPVHPRCFEVLDQAKRVQDLARRDRSDWQNDLVKLWRQAIKDREKREARDRAAWRRAPRPWLGSAGPREGPQQPR